MARLFARFLVFSVILAAAAAAGAFWLYAEYTRPGPLKSDVTLVIPRGVGVERIATILADAGVIAKPLAFRVVTQATGAARDLQAGEYRFTAAMSKRQVVDLLRSGRTVVRRLTIAEGLTTAQVLGQLAATEGLIGGPVTIPGEGTLLPETYHFSFGDSRREVLMRMRQAMTDALSRHWETRDPTVPLASPREMLILASIVEKETARPEERARIAGVFINRLRKGMRLQSDPTVAYGAGEGRRLGRALTRADLETPTPFNTYTNDGLPPAPICNPGLASIAAVSAPLQTDELYFVADGEGGHAFSRTLDEHNRNVQRWRRLQRERPDTPADG